MKTRDKADRRAIVIAGPTASGKSALAIALAERLNGVVINADSMQVYADLRILTARPSDDDMTRVPHRLFGHVDAAEAYSVGRWLKEAREVLDETWRERRIPIVVGGTGLYLKALTQGLSDIPEISPQVRFAVRREAEHTRPEALHEQLGRLDAVMAARLRPSDSQRVLRALEVIRSTGRSLADFQLRRTPIVLSEQNVAGVVLAPLRNALHVAIESRVDAMVDAGVIAEVGRLAARELNPTLPAMRAVGVPDLIAVLQRKVDLNQATLKIKVATRHYAKRQLTFARHQLGFLPWIAPEEAVDAVLLKHRDWTAGVALDLCSGYPSRK